MPFNWNVGHLSIQDSLIANIQIDKVIALILYTTQVTQVASLCGVQVNF
jgi:hypothetical protein